MPEKTLEDFYTDDKGTRSVLNYAFSAQRVHDLIWLEFVFLQSCEKWNKLFGWSIDHPTNNGYKFRKVMRFLITPLLI